jgi:CDP-paratose 2-epimerase
MSIIVITGSSGLVGSQAARHFHELGWEVWGVDNDMRAEFFGAEASTRWMQSTLLRDLKRFRHHDIDIRDEASIERLFASGGRGIEAVIHAAAQPSHDWAARDPQTDFTVNANGTLNLLEATLRHAPSAPFVFTSTNKVYGDTPNTLPLLETETRYELPDDHVYFGGIPETMSIDRSTHSLFGVSKTAADLLVQEYGRYFDLATACFRGGCLTGPGHSGAQLHGFLSYLMKCTVTGDHYTVFGYKGKQVRDNIHSADLVTAFEAFLRTPRSGAVYNIGGGRQANCSMIEAIELCEEISGRELNWTYSDESRIGDHKWWVSDLTAFSTDHPSWRLRYGIKEILQDIYDNNVERWQAA